MKAGGSYDIISMAQTSEAVSEHIFGIEDTWSIEVEGKIEGTFKDMNKGSLTMTDEYGHKTFERLKSAYSEALTSEHIRKCEEDIRKCHDEGKNGYLWMTRVDLSGQDKYLIDTSRCPVGLLPGASRVVRGPVSKQRHGTEMPSEIL